MWFRKREEESVKKERNMQRMEGLACTSKIKSKQIVGGTMKELAFLSCGLFRFGTERAMQKVGGKGKAPLARCPSGAGGQDIAQSTAGKGALCNRIKTHGPFVQFSAHNSHVYS